MLGQVERDSCSEATRTSSLLEQFAFSLSVMQECLLLSYSGKFVG